MSDIGVPAFPVGLFQENLQSSYFSQQHSYDDKFQITDYAEFSHLVQKSIAGIVKCPNWSGVEYLVLPSKDAEMLSASIAGRWKHEILAFAQHRLTYSNLTYRQNKNSENTAPATSALLIYARGETDGPPNVLLALLCNEQDLQTRKRFIEGVSIAVARAGGKRMRLEPVCTDEADENGLGFYVRSPARKLGEISGRLQSKLEYFSANGTYPGWVNFLSICAPFIVSLGIVCLMLGFTGAGALLGVMGFGVGLFLDRYLARIGFGS
jgi:hypothetical protein